MDILDVYWKKFYMYSSSGDRLGEYVYRLGRSGSTSTVIKQRIDTYVAQTGVTSLWSADALIEVDSVMELGLQQIGVPSAIHLTQTVSGVTYDTTIDVTADAGFNNLLQRMPSLANTVCPDISIIGSAYNSFWLCVDDDFDSDYALRVQFSIGGTGGLVLDGCRINGLYTSIGSPKPAFGCSVRAFPQGGSWYVQDVYYGLNCITADNNFYFAVYYTKTRTNMKHGFTTTSDLNSIITVLNAAENYTPPKDDPFEPGGYSGTGGGGGGQNFASTPIGRAPLPTLSFADTGFCRIYNPTLSQLQALANYMWTDDTFLQTLINHAKQLLEDPIEAIISLSLVPVPVPNGTAQEVKVLFIPTGVSMPPVTNQFVEVDCGTLSLPVEDQYGAALDFNPYTKIDLYLPYIGQVSIDVDEVMYKTMHCVYRVDVVTGMCVAIISVGTGTDETVLYQFAGHCGVQMPLNSADFSGWVGAIVTAAKTIGGFAAAGAGGAGPAAALIGAPSPSTSKTTRTTQGGGYTFQSSQTGRNPSTGRQITLGTESRARTNLPEVVTTTHETTPASFGELAARGTANTVDAIIGSKMHFEHAGSFSGNSGYIAGVRRPYAILKRPRQCYPENYASYRGFPAMIYMNLGDCTGYTEVHDIHLTGISATNPELGELAQLLKTGVIL